MGSGLDTATTEALRREAIDSPLKAHETLGSYEPETLLQTLEQEWTKDTVSEALAMIAHSSENPEHVDAVIDQLIHEYFSSAEITDSGTFPLRAIETIAQTRADKFGSIVPSLCDIASSADSDRRRYALGALVTIIEGSSELDADYESLLLKLSTCWNSVETTRERTLATTAIQRTLESAPDGSADHVERVIEHLDPGSATADSVLWLQFLKTIARTHPDAGALGPVIDSLRNALTDSSASPVEQQYALRALTAVCRNELSQDVFDDLEELLKNVAGLQESTGNSSIRDDAVATLRCANDAVPDSTFPDGVTDAVLEENSESSPVDASTQSRAERVAALLTDGSTEGPSRTAESLLEKPEETVCERLAEDPREFLEVLRDEAFWRAIDESIRPDAAAESDTERAVSFGSGKSPGSPPREAFISDLTVLSLKADGLGGRIEAHLRESDSDTVTVRDVQNASPTALASVDQLDRTRYLDIKSGHFQRTLRTVLVGYVDGNYNVTIPTEEMVDVLVSIVEAAATVNRGAVRRALDAAVDEAIRAGGADGRSNTVNRTATLLERVASTEPELVTIVASGAWITTDDTVSPSEPPWSNTWYHIHRADDPNRCQWAIRFVRTVLDAGDVELERDSAAYRVNALSKAVRELDASTGDVLEQSIQDIRRILENEPVADENDDERVDSTVRVVEALRARLEANENVA